MEGKALEFGNVIARNWSDLVENVCAPDIALLNVVQAFVARADKMIDVLCITHLIILSPV